MRWISPDGRWRVDRIQLILTGDVSNPESVVVRPGCFLTSRAGTPYTMTAGPEGVTYMETSACR